MRWRRTTACERAAQWISLELDDELGELDQAALARHLRRCSGCRAARAEIGGFTRLLRETPLIGISRPAVVASPRRARLRATRRAAFVVLPAAAAAVAFGLTALPGNHTTSVSSLGFRNAHDQRRFAREHVLVEPRIFVDASTAPPLSFGFLSLG